MSLTIYLGYQISSAIAAAFAAATIATVLVKLLTWTRVLKSCFRKRQAVSSWDKNKICFILQDRLENHNFGEIVGVFDTESGRLVGEVEAFEAEAIDATLQQHHEEYNLLVMS